MKKILVISILILIVFLIYLSTIDRKIYYLVLGNNTNFDITGDIQTYTGNVERYLSDRDILEKTVENFVEKDDRITDVINNIKNNVEVIANNKKYSLKNSLIKADVLTISIGVNELKAKLLLDSNQKDVYIFLDQLLSDYNELFKIVREYCKEDIILIGYYSSDNKYKEYMNYLNKKLKNLTNDYSIEYIDMNEDKNISEEIIKIIDKKVLH